MSNARWAVLAIGSLLVVGSAVAGRSLGEPAPPDPLGGLVLVTLGVFGGALVRAGLGDRGTAIPTLLEYPLSAILAGVVAFLSVSSGGVPVNPLHLFAVGLAVGSVAALGHETLLRSRRAVFVAVSGTVLACVAVVLVRDLYVSGVIAGGALLVVASVFGGVTAATEYLIAERESPRPGTG